ncbi:MAG: 2-C-methyl-D-erythritol 2,4-cyclodiphosphate synthase [Leucobacter sp.]
MIRIGNGFDVHRYSSEVPLVLAGLTWPGEPGLDGHSDGDAVCHATVDALLSAANLGDIGELVGVDDPALQGAASTDFVVLARERLAAAGWAPINVSVQIIGEHPRFSPRRSEAQEAMSWVLGAPVSIAATTTDGIGFTGRGEGLAVYATALITQQ